MKHIIALLMVTIVVFSCNEEDTTVPSIEIEEPTVDFAVELNSSFNLVYNIKDEGKIVSHTLDIIDGNGTLIESKEQEAKTGSFTEAINITQNIVQPLILKIRAEDETGNIGSEAIELDILGVDLIFRLNYDGADLNYFDKYEYPSGEAMNFTRFSTYISDITFGGNDVKDIDFIRIQKEVGDTSTTEMHVYEVNTVKKGQYNQIAFKLGVPESMNAMKPADFLSTHPLSRSDEYWNSWESYIFTKIEGNIDRDENTDLETPIALHLGGNDALMEFTFPVNLELSDTRKRLILDIDLYKVFKNGEDIYDISVSSTHSLSQLPSIVQLADNLEQAISVRVE